MMDTSRAAMLFEAPHEVPPASPLTASLVASLAQTVAQIESLERAREEIEAELAKLVPPDAGEYTINTPTHQVTATRGETWRWDKEKLAEMFGADAEPPPFIKRTLSVVREEFEALPTAEQVPLLPLLRRRPAGTVKFSIKEI